MEFLNHTQDSAELISGPHGPAEQGVCVLAKRTLPLDPAAIGPQAEFHWPVSRTELKTDFGDFPFEHHFPLPKLDFMVLGEACTPNGRPMRETLVRLQVGRHFVHEERVLGDRVWKKALLSYKASDPVPFTRMPLTLKQAFGGTVELENGTLSHVDNPLGKGYLVKGVDPENRSLPNIECPNEPMREPFDLVRTTCMAPYPLAGGLRYRDKITAQGVKPYEREDNNGYFGQAHPDLVMEKPAAGTPISLDGMHALGPLRLEVPHCPFQCLLSVNGQSRPLRFSLDAICLFTHLNRGGFRWRAAGTFVLEPRQSRQVRLELAP